MCADVRKSMSGRDVDPTRPNVITENLFSACHQCHQSESRDFFSAFLAKSMLVATLCTTTVVVQYLHMKEKPLPPSRLCLFAFCCGRNLPPPQVFPKLFLISGTSSCKELKQEAISFFFWRWISIILLLLLFQLFLLS